MYVYIFASGLVVTLLGLLGGYDGNSDHAWGGSLWAVILRSLSLALSRALSLFLSLSLLLALPRRNPKPESQTPKSQTRNPELETRILDPGSGIQKSQTPNPKLETLNPKPQICSP